MAAPYSYNFDNTPRLQLGHMEGNRWVPPAMVAPPSADTVVGQTTETFDTSVKDPTPEQVEETLEFLHSVLEIGAPQNEWEQRAVQTIINRLEGAMGGGENAYAE